MKYLAIIIIALIAISAISAKVTRHRSHKSHKSHARRHRGIGANFGQFMLGALVVIGDAQKFLDGCVAKIPGLENLDAGAAANNSTNNVKAQDQSLWDKVLGFLGTAINVVCTIKDKLITYFTSKLKRYRRMMRRNRRLFLQGKRLRNFRKNWFTDIWDDITDFVGGAADMIQQGVAWATGHAVSLVVDGVNWATKTAKQIGDFIAEAIKRVIKPLGEAFEAIKAKIMGFINSPWVQNAILIFNCIKQAVGAVQTLIKTITGFVSNIAALGTPAGWIKLLVNMICGWETLKAAIEQFKHSWTQPAPAKWNHFGRGLGNLVKAIAG